MIDGLLPADAASGTFLGRVWRPELGGPSLVTLRDGLVVDITSAEAPTVSALLERDDAAAFVRGAQGEPLGPVSELGAGIALLAPCDLQVVKACGVTFAQSMLERVIEERAAGDPDLAEQVRAEVTAIVGGSLRQVVAGSETAAKVKAALIEKGIWSQYLEVGIGPDAEVFTKAPVLSSVGSGAEIGLHPISTWNNPEPEIVLAVSSRGEIRGASLGNDVNLRDVEGRSALLLGKAKDNNASCAIGPFIRLFDAGYTLDDVRRADLDMEVTGVDGFVLQGHSTMRAISRDPVDLVAATCGAHHQYPDGFVLFLGTLFAPTEDRDAPGQGFTHHLGDVVRIRNDRLGTLQNTVRLSTECPPWEFGVGALMRNLAGRGLLG
jgi:fumarylacetoacetate (FAA) hydrolase family protein